MLPSNVLQADVEGLTLMREGGTTWLIASGQDDSDTDGEQPAAGRDRQNFKLVEWRDVKAALKLP
ncbi:hypothetical protein [Phenylobacterium sp. J367]|uniref:hypothetical protein n=1 Tax=Phenylobacterium sp. J367 TaxID=2898435 RepID=UPI0021507A64|nr:hypothetical protein [Phenylobacterium sp. J367]MCR5881084.1 hypothetical protein [Phenylobacterium sp. J367]